MEFAPSLPAPSDALHIEFHQVVVPTLESVRFLYPFLFLLLPKLLCIRGFYSVVSFLPLLYSSTLDRFLAELLITHGKHVLITGPTGTGKTANIKDLLLHKLNQNKYFPVFLTLSDQTSANQTQDTIDFKVLPPSPHRFNSNIVLRFTLF